MLPYRDLHHQETLRSYQWVSRDHESSFDEDLMILRSRSRSMAVGIAIPLMGAWLFKAGIGNRSMFNERIEKECENTLEAKDSYVSDHFAAIPLRSSENTIFAILFCIEPQKNPQIIPLLKRTGRHIVTSLELRRINKILELRSEELKEKSRQLVDLKRSHKEFISHFSHELRTPLQSILGLSELMADQGGKVNIPKLTNTLHQSAVNMLETLNTLLDHAKNESQTLQLNPSKLKLESFLKDATQSFEQLLKKRGLDFHLDLQISEKLQCSLDKVRLRQLIQNLLNNASRFTDHGFISLEGFIDKDLASTEMSWLTIRVRDTGIGIDEHNKGLIFEPYRQVSGDASRGGSGLGLSICKTIVEAMDGQIGFESELGKGSSFWFRIPLKLEVHEGKETYNHRELPSNKSEEPKGGQILVIEDNPITRTVTLKQLDQLGFQVTSAGRLREVREFLSEKSFDLILMDLHIGKVPPKKLVEIVRAATEAPIVVASGSQIVEKDWAVDGVLPKPYSREALLEMLHSWIHSERRAHEIARDLDQAFHVLEDSVGSQFVWKTIENFLKRHPLDIERLQGYLDQENWAKLELSAHSMKSTLATLGLMEQSRLMQEIEGSTLQKCKISLNTLLDHYRAEARRTYPHLMRFGKKLQDRGQKEKAS